MATVRYRPDEFLALPETKQKQVLCDLWDTCCRCHGAVLKEFLAAAERALDRRDAQLIRMRARAAFTTPQRFANVYAVYAALAMFAQAVGVRRY